MAQTTQQTPTVHKTSTHHARMKKADPAPQQPQTPPTPATLEQQAPVAPQVTYRNGLFEYQCAKFDFVAGVAGGATTDGRSH